MARSSGRKNKGLDSSQQNPSPPPPSTPSASMLGFLGYNPSGQMEQRSVVNSKDGWSEYTLDDGSKISAKASLIDVKRAAGQFSPNGDPVYVMQFALVNNLVPGENTKKPKT
jgi:hypothetical protein